MLNLESINFAFFGSSQFSVFVLNELEGVGLIPSIIVTTPDKPVGRKLILTPTSVKVWGNQRMIKVLDPIKLDDSFGQQFEKICHIKKAGHSNEKVSGNHLGNVDPCELFIIASYGKIIPQSIINIPKFGALNVHPSLLPRYRGPSPLQSIIVNDEKNTGVTIIKIDDEMDHGPIIAQKEIQINEWPTYENFEEMMATEEGQLLAEIMPRWLAGGIQIKEQDHSKATYTKKISKEDGLIDLNNDPYKNFLKIQAYHRWPQAYFITTRAGKRIRIKITQASFKDGQLIIEKVIPEGGGEMGYEDFQRGNH